MKIFSIISRWFVGVLFIFSGIIKANDPLGFSYKLEEYFVEFGMNWDWLLNLALPLAMFICILEIVLWLGLIFAYKLKYLSWALLLLILFFTILTFASAVFDIVRSCGCFGDAIPLTPWQSFYKDIILLAFIIFIFIRKNKIEKEAFNSLKTEIISGLFFILILCFISLKLSWLFPLFFTLFNLLLFAFFQYFIPHRAKLYSIIIAILSSFVFTNYCYNHLPIKDFRPYAEGINIQEGMQLPPNAQAPVYETKLYYEKNGKIKEFTTDNYPWDDTTWKWVDTKTVLVKEGDEAPIHDFSITSLDGVDYTDSILNLKNYLFMFIAYNLEKSNKKAFQKIKNIINKVKKDNIIILTAASKKEIIDLKNHYPAIKKIKFYNLDETTLKTIIRSNPGLVILKKGTIIKKIHYNDFDKAITFKNYLIQ